MLVGECHYPETGVPLKNKQTDRCRYDNRHVQDGGWNRRKGGDTKCTKSAMMSIPTFGRKSNEGDHKSGYFEKPTYKLVEVGNGNNERS